MEFSIFEPVPVSEESGVPLAIAESGPAGLQPLRRIQWAQAVVLAALFSFPGILCLRAAHMVDPDIWWHLRTGEWILQHHAVPHTDPFSSIGAGKPWSAYSWLFELLVYQLFLRLGLVGLVRFSQAPLRGHQP